MFKALKEKASSFVGMQTKLVAFGISAAITLAVAVGISVLTGDHSQLAYAKIKRLY